MHMSGRYVDMQTYVCRPKGAEQAGNVRTKLSKRKTSHPQRYFEDEGRQGAG